ncbi:MAG TPA: hypothetical protein VGQ42_09715 [Candidatus Dormibacteraeota bacterium]|jgi:hypothetical protein|nr:hypothetical protein [Candidatus Dormibacteraeota bacterium]
MDGRDAALATLAAAAERDQLDRPKVIRALDVLAASDPGDDAGAGALSLGEAMLAGRFGERLHADVLQGCIAVLARTAYREALDFYRAASAVHLPTPTGDNAAVLRAHALLALRALEPNEARFVAARLVAEGPRANSGEPAATAIAVLGAAGDDVALVAACHSGLQHEIPLLMAALQQLSPSVPASTFWEIATPLVSDRFSDAVLAIADLIVAGRRSDLVPGFGLALTEVSDPDLARAVLLSLSTARLDGLEPAFTAVVERAPRRALEGIADALELARIPAQDRLLTRLQERLRRTEG